MNRRDFLGVSTLPLVSIAAPALFSAAQAEAEPAAFDRSAVRQMARDLASKPFKAADEKLPEGLQDLDYDHYRQIRFLPEHALWRGEKLPFEVQFFHRGFFYAPGSISTRSPTARPPKSPTARTSSPSADKPPPAAGSDLGFAGFRLHAPINRPDYYDEVCVFLGASYFRAVAKGEVYGLSARGLAINTGRGQGRGISGIQGILDREAAANANSIVVHALLDSESAAAAYRFTIRPGRRDGL